MRLQFDDLPETAFWRIDCRTIENGRDVNAEIVATLSAGHPMFRLMLTLPNGGTLVKKQVRPATQ